jgi:glycosyltransferase involved in cell wall biosynthesis
VREGHRIVYVTESAALKRYYAGVHALTSKGGVNWPLQHALSYPVYGEFNRKVYARFAGPVRRKVYDVVHAMTPILPRYPVKLVSACSDVPFLLGPVNGGVPFPEGFQEVARKEFARFNFLRAFTRLLPGYARTYQRADGILSGSTYTLEMLLTLFRLNPDRISLFPENGIAAEFIGKARPRTGKRLHLLFVGRLVPYKGADMVIEAVAALPERVRENVRFTVVGDGAEKGRLERLASNAGVGHIVNFVGWVVQKETLRYYQEADVFCFPSVREFGGAVALEAMACGLPCIVADHAGLGEYVTPSTGCKIKPVSREYVMEKMAENIQLLYENESLRYEMAQRAVERVREFEWQAKARQMAHLYEDLISRKARKEKGP